MRSKSLNSSVRFNALSGLSLLELGLVMAIVALALVPMVKSIGGPMNSNGKGSAAQTTGAKNKESILAMRLANQVLSGDTSSFMCGTSNINLPSSGLTTYPGVGEKCSASQEKLKYDWTVMPVDRSQNNIDLPQGNSYYKALLNIYPATGENQNTPTLSIPVSFFQNVPSGTLTREKTGVVLAMDVSGSMEWAADERQLSYGYFKDEVEAGKYTQANLESKPGGVASPFLWYRYNDFPTPGTVNNWGYTFPVLTGSSVALSQRLNMWDNRALDLAVFQNYSGRNGSDPNLGTPYNEAYLNSNYSVFDCRTTRENQWIYGNGAFKEEFAYIFNKEWVLDSDPIATYNRQNFIFPLCKEKNNVEDWERISNQYMSRLEAARTGAISLLLKLEERPAISSVIKLGFLPWAKDIYPEDGSRLEIATANPYTNPNPDELVTPKVFRHLRERLLWINRLDPSDKNSTNPVELRGGTNIYNGLDEAKNWLLADNNITRRIIILLTDGAPAPNEGQNANGPYGSGGLRDYVKNNLGCGLTGKNAQRRITLLTVGLIQAERGLLRDMASSTPSGLDFFATNVAELGPVFDGVTYEIQKQALLTTSDRFNLDKFENDQNPCNR